jgi:septal ring factor EnvC (AmiA/AmiB activator)
MGPELVWVVIGALFSVLSGKLVFTQFAEKLGALLARKVRGTFNEEAEPDEKLSYAERLEELTNSLRKSSAQIDGLLNELSDVAKERETAVARVENELLNLETREKELQERIDHLKDVPIPVAEHLAKLMAPSEKRSARRDYLLFVSGVVVSTIIAILLRVLGLA